MNTTPLNSRLELELGWDTDLVGRNILLSLRRIIRAVAIYSRELQRRRNITTTQLATLRRLAREGPMSAGDLARAISVSQATITGVLDRLEKPGLIVRNRDTQDRRRVVVELTEAGRETVQDAPPPLHERFMVRLAELPEAARREIDRTLQEIVVMMEAEDVDASPVLTAEPSLTDGIDSRAAGTASTEAR